MKYKREFESDALPCGSRVLAQRPAGKRNWLLEDVPQGLNPLATDAVVQARSIPGVIRFLQYLYDNTPTRYKK